MQDFCLHHTKDVFFHRCLAHVRWYNVNIVSSVVSFHISKASRIIYYLFIKASIIIYNAQFNKIPL